MTKNRSIFVEHTFVYRLMILIIEFSDILVAYSGLTKCEITPSFIISNDSDLSSSNSAILVTSLVFLVSRRDSECPTEMH